MTARAPESVDDLGSITTYGEAVRVFFSRPGPRRIAKTAATMWAARALLGPPGPADVLALTGTAAWWPLQEWLMHKYLLHLEPKERFGLHVDPSFARTHRAHHRDPKNVDRTLLPLEVITAAIPASSAIFLGLLGPRRRTVTAMATYSSMALLYEWTHFLVHTGIEPEGDYYRRVRRNHLLHHFRNENYWLGFTVPAVDALLGTEPPPASVPRSPTATNLHGLPT
jgi:hypothetical protein